MTKRLALLALLALLYPRDIPAQVLGVFRWQMQPYCNLVTFTVIQQGPAYQLTGSDDLCGAPQVAPATGTATLNPNGTISLGFDVVVPSGAAAHVSATVHLSNVSGTWSDADGNSGGFAFNPPGVTGSPRPAPSRSVAITSAQLAASIFAGSGSAGTIARSDHVHDDRYYTQAQSDALVADAVELIATPGRFVPTLVNEFPYTSSTSETITSTVAGQWLVSKTTQALLNCPSNSPVFFLMVDGVPLVSSAIAIANNTFTSLTLVGATAGPLPAGAHTVSVGADCLAQTHISGGITLFTAATVTIVR
ncbi:MAG: hypothetical protein R2712_32105 [Vicinamibacterales bacterium]